MKVTLAVNRVNNVPSSGKTAHVNPWVSVLILTRNESVHVKRCVESAKNLTPLVFVVDSNSLDNTAKIANESGATVISGNFKRFSDKLNWSMENIDFPTQWVFRLDADEVLTQELVENLKNTIDCAPDDVCGVYVRRQLWFMGSWVRHGGMYPTFSMRLWKKGTVRCESRDLDEHMIMSVGSVIRLNLDVIDNPLFDLTSWIEKHNGYASLEAFTALNESTADTLIKPELFGDSVARKRWLKVHIFYRLPLFIRPFLYFLYRYIFRFGFLDGVSGFIFHFMHGLWYRILIDAKILETQKKLQLNCNEKNFLNQPK